MFQNWCCEVGGTSCGAAHESRLLWGSGFALQTSLALAVSRANLAVTRVELTGRAVAPGSGISCVYFKPDELGNLNSYRTQTWRAQPLDHRARHLTCQNTKQSLTYRHKPGGNISTNLKYRLLEGPIAAALT